MRIPVRTRVTAPVIAVAVVALTSACLSSAPTAFASSSHCHTFYADEGRQYIEDPELRAFTLTEELEIYLLNGAFFPDSGYAASDSRYGEWAHWEPFPMFYIDWIRANFDAPYTEGEAAKHVMALFGIVAHGMSDAVFDGMLMDRSREHDPDHDNSQYDINVDHFFVQDQNRNRQFGAVLPFEDLAEVIRLYQGWDIDPDVYKRGQELVVTSMGFIGASAQNEAGVNRMRRNYEWTSDNYFNADVPGSLPYIARLMGRYYQAVWERLNGGLTQESFVLGWYTPRGFFDRATDHTSVESRLGLWFGESVAPAYRNSDWVVVTDESGDVVSANVRGIYGDESYPLFVRPAQDWVRDHTYTVTVRAGMETVDGTVLEDDFVFTFAIIDEEPTPVDGGDTGPDGGEVGTPDAGSSPDTGIDAGVDTDGDTPEVGGETGVADASANPTTDPEIRVSGGGCATARPAGPGVLAPLLLMIACLFRSRA